MNEKKYYINGVGPSYSKPLGGKRQFAIKYKKQHYSTRTERISLFKYREVTTSYYTTHSIAVPVFLYGDGNEFFEFFTRRFFGKKSDYRGHYVTGEGTNVSNSLNICTCWYCREEYGDDSYYGTVKECEAAEFLEEVTRTKNRLADVGISEQELIDQINKIFDVAEAKERQRIADEERRRAEAARAEEQRKIQNEAAKKVLEEMIEG